MSTKRSSAKRRVMVVTGSRAEFGLLRPVMEAVEKHKKLELRVVVAGEHLLGPAQTWKEVAEEFAIEAKVAMQRASDRGRIDHAAACARGMAGFAAVMKKVQPEWVVVLGDRIEAFAAASAASIGGVAVGHIHGGDRAEGIADEAMRHAITKLAHLHCAATKGSAERIRKMGEPAKLVHVTGSPAIDGLSSVKAMGDRDAKKYGDPESVILIHPSGLDAEAERLIVAGALNGAMWSGCVPCLVLAPNRDPGSEVVRTTARRTAQLITSRALASDLKYFTFCDHMPRPEFLSLLKRLSHRRLGMIIGNSSAGLIEAAALGLKTINIGPRQNGRERGANVFDVPFDKRAWDVETTVESVIERADRRGSRAMGSRFGDGRSGPRIAALLTKVDPRDGALLRKQNSY